MNNKSLLFLTFLLFSTSIVFGQTRKQYLKHAENSYAQKDFYAAMKYYEEVLEFDTMAIDPWYKMGVSAREFFALSIAENAFKTVCGLPGAENYPSANLLLADVQKGMGKYTEAIESYKKVLTGSDPEAKAKATSGIEACEWAAEVVANPDENVEVINLGDAINSPASETAPQKIGNDFYYTSLRFQDPNDKHDPPRNFQKILKSENGSTAEIWETFNVPKGHVGNAVFSNNGLTRVYFTLCDYISDGETRCEIYYRDQNPDSGEWSESKKMPGEVNSPNATSTHPEVATVGDEYWLFFASDKAGGKGGIDIYYSVIGENGSFGDAMNLESINTEGDDITPFYHEATNTLFFSNNSRQGLGGHDVFKSIKTGSEWSAPEHLGYPLNSSLDDLFYKPSKGGASGYIASNRLGSTYIEKEKEACCHDLYSVQMQTVELLVTTFDKVTKEPLSGVTVTLSKLNGPEVESLTNTTANDFEFAPERKYAYLLTATKEGFTTVKDTVYLNQPPGDDMLSISKEMFLEQNEITLDVFTFDAYTKEGLVGTEVQLFEMVDGERKLVEKKSNPGGNDFSFKLLPGRTYVVRGSKNGFEHDLKTIEIPTADKLTETKMSVDLFLTPLIFAEFLPISLYFDNDQPNPRSQKTTTQKTYLETWDVYKNRESAFKTEAGKGVDGMKKDLVLKRLQGFFKEEVVAGGENFKTFSNLLYEFLKLGNNIELILRGYTSPRAASDYNDKLSARRIVSVKNHFNEFNGGIFKQFVDSGSLVIIEKPFGESQAKQDVSDDMQDVRNSVYGVPASLERRVEIIDVRQAEDAQSGTR